MYKYFNAIEQGLLGGREQNHMGFYFLMRAFCMGLFWEVWEPKKPFTYFLEEWNAFLDFIAVTHLLSLHLRYRGLLTSL